MFSSLLLAMPVLSSSIPIVTFDGADGTTFKFTQMNDPVMGGKSTGTWTVQDGYGAMTGEVVNVPSLKAPGFIKSSADGKFADVSSAAGGDLVLTVRSKSASYAGYRLSFASGTLSPSYSCAGGGQIPFSRGCFKTHFTVPMAGAGDDFVDIRIPFGNFSDLWSPATGANTKTCAQDSSACATAKVLKSIVRFEIWAEGAAGKIDIDIKAISAVPAAGSRLAAPESQRPPAKNDKCSGPVQTDLNFGISGRTTPAGVWAPVDDNESLAEAICCDDRAVLYAEPQFLFQAPDILMYNKMDKDGVTVFYDSVCGLPLFKTPVNRTFADWQADTNEHGWPSFRTAEVFTENVVTNMTSTLVTSRCGTHLGTYLPDDSGPRWCIDLSCIAGNKSA